MREYKRAGQIVWSALSTTFMLGFAAVASPTAALAAMQLSQQVQFDIPPQELPSALLKFSAQSAVQVTSPGRLVEGKKSQGVVGTFSAGKALTLLLKDTTLNFDVIDGRTVVIIAATAAKVTRPTAPWLWRRAHQFIWRRRAARTCGRVRFPTTAPAAT
jgi:hypothetical protein